MIWTDSVVTPALASHVSRAQCGLLLLACHEGVYARLRRAMEKVGMRGPLRESELVETPPHRAEFGFSPVPCGPLPARGARNAEARRAALVGNTRPFTPSISVSPRAHASALRQSDRASSSSPPGRDS